MWQHYKSAASISEAVETLAAERGKARIAAGTTDLILELERGVRPGVETLVDISRIHGIDQITLDEDGFIHLAPLVTHNECVGSKIIQEQAFPLAQACWEVGSPQIRNRGTIVGNLVTASPANDTIPALMALGASVKLRSARSERVVALDNFYTGVRKTVMEEDEMVVDVFFPAMQAGEKGTFTKFALRKAQAISVVDAAIVLKFNGEQIVNAQITLGSVATTVVHATQAEAYLQGKVLSEETIKTAAEKCISAASPISDLRGSDKYRQRIIRICVERTLSAIAAGTERDRFPNDPVLLVGKQTAAPDDNPWDNSEPIITTINGKTYTFEKGHQKTLLRLLREEGYLTGTKEGCSEGECGACTVYLDGKAVMSCLVPGPRAHGANITTIEGIAEETLHPVQEAFIEEGAVQCGYCTPGFIMSAVKLLEEKPNPTTEQIKQSITGNLCRCTGYYKIIQAIETAALNLRK